NPDRGGRKGNPYLTAGRPHLLVQRWDGPHDHAGQGGELGCHPAGGGTSVMESYRLFGCHGLHLIEYGFVLSSLLTPAPRSSLFRTPVVGVSITFNLPRRLPRRLLARGPRA